MKGICEMASQEKMKPWVINGPRTTKAKIIVSLVIFSIILGVAPIITIVNKNMLLFGLPALMIWTIFIGCIVMGVIALARKWQVF